MWYDNFKIGDTIRYDICIMLGVSETKEFIYGKTGKTKDFILTEEIFENIKKYEDESNFHNMRVVNNI